MSTLSSSDRESLLCMAASWVSVVPARELLNRSNSASRSNPAMQVNIAFTVYRRGGVLFKPVPVLAVTAEALGSTNKNDDDCNKNDNPLKYPSFLLKEILNGVEAPCLGAPDVTRDHLFGVLTSTRANYD